MKLRVLLCLTTIFAASFAYEPKLSENMIQLIMDHRMASDDLHKLTSSVNGFYYVINKIIAMKKYIKSAAVSTYQGQLLFKYIRSLATVERIFRSKIVPAVRQSRTVADSQLWELTKTYYAKMAENGDANAALQAFVEAWSKYADEGSITRMMGSAFFGMTEKHVADLKAAYTFLQDPFGTQTTLFVPYAQNFIEF